MINQRTLVLTGTTDILRKQEDTDSYMEEVFDLTLPSKQRYVKRHGYDLLSLRSFGEDTGGIFKNTNIGFLRFVRAFEMLEYYDTVMWIDADSIITNTNFSINEFGIDDTCSFYASWDWNGKYSISGGNIIVHKTQHTNELFDTFLEIGKQVLLQGIWGEEQTTINHMYNNTPFKENIKILDHAFLGSVPSKKHFLGHWGTRNEPPYPWTTNSFLAHIGGVSNKSRIEVLKTSFGEYL